MENNLRSKAAGTEEITGSKTIAPDWIMVIKFRTEPKVAASSSGGIADESNDRALGFGTTTLGDLSRRRLIVLASTACGGNSFRRDLIDIRSNWIGFRSGWQWDPKTRKPDGYSP
jgi:hypothetical protein